MKILEYMFFHWYKRSERKLIKNPKAVESPRAAAFVAMFTPLLLWTGCLLLWIDQSFPFISRGPHPNYSNWLNRFGPETLPVWLMIVGVFTFTYLAFAQPKRVEKILTRFASSTKQELKVGSTLSAMFLIGSLAIPLFLVSTDDFRPLILVALVFAYGEYWVSRRW